MSLLTKITKGKSHAEVKPRAWSVKEQVVATLTEYHYCTRRHLNQQTGIEIATLCGALASLKSAGKIREAFTTICDTTGKEVIVYALNTSEVE